MQYISSINIIYLCIMRISAIMLRWWIISIRNILWPKSKEWDMVYKVYWYIQEFIWHLIFYTKRRERHMIVGFLTCRANKGTKPTYIVILQNICWRRGQGLFNVYVFLSLYIKHNRDMFQSGKTIVPTSFMLYWDKYNFKKF